jgi:ankyrin repeat protein
VKVLFSHGVNVQKTAANGWTALHGAVRMRHDDLVRYLIEQGANVGAVTESGETALHVLCSISTTWQSLDLLSIADMLLKHGANLEAKNNTGATPLYLAFRTSRDNWSYTPDLINMLLQRGADKHVMDNAGKRGIDLINQDRLNFDDAGMLQEETFRL